MKTPALAAALLVFAAQHARADLATVLAVNPPSLDVWIGQIFTVDLSTIKSFELNSWQLDLSFDQTLLTAISVTEGPFLGTAGATNFSPGTIDNTSGTITGIAGGLQNSSSSVSDQGVLATMQFQAIATGTSALTISNMAAYGSGPILLVKVRSEDGSVTVQPAPEPATVGLFAFGALLLGIAAKRRKSLAD